VLVNHVEPTLDFPQSLESSSRQSTKLRQLSPRVTAYNASLTFSSTSPPGGKASHDALAHRSSLYASFPRIFPICECAKLKIRLEFSERIHRMSRRRAATLMFSHDGRSRYFSCHPFPSPVLIVTSINSYSFSMLTPHGAKAYSQPPKWITQFNGYHLSGPV